MRKRFIPALLLAAFLAGSVQAEVVSDSLRTTIYYRTASARLELPYMDNDRHLGALGDSIRSLGADPAVVLRRIFIQASASRKERAGANWLKSSDVPMPPGATRQSPSSVTHPSGWYARARWWTVANVS